MTPRLIVFIVAGLLPTLTLAEPLPQPKPVGPGGSCPHGWMSSGSSCVPSQGAQDAIAKPPNGTCPWGWISSGSYCLRSQKAPAALAAGAFSLRAQPRARYNHERPDAPLADAPGLAASTTEGR
jgi:hypothetical protein